MLTMWIKYDIIVSYSKEKMCIMHKSEVFYREEKQKDHVDSVSCDSIDNMLGTSDHCGNLVGKAEGGT